MTYTQREIHLRKQAEDHGYRLVKNRGGYTLVDASINAIMYHYQDVSLDTVEAFFVTT